MNSIDGAAGDGCRKPRGRYGGRAARRGTPHTYWALLLATTSVSSRTGAPFATTHCGTVADGYRVECVLPEPYTTRGEARVLGEQVLGHGWSRVAVLTSAPHAARARMLVERCTDAEVLVWTVGNEPRGVRGWGSAFVYQSAAWVKAQLLRGC